MEIMYQVSKAIDVEALDWVIGVCYWFWKFITHHGPRLRGCERGSSECDFKLLMVWYTYNVSCFSLETRVVTISFIGAWVPRIFPGLKCWMAAQSWGDVVAPVWPSCPCLLLLADCCLWYCAPSRLGFSLKAVGACCYVCLCSVSMLCCLLPKLSVQVPACCDGSLLWSPHSDAAVMIADRRNVC